MKSLGGYFELDLPQTGEYHRDAVRLNTGRNAFEYILRVKKYSSIYLPYYICNVMLEPIHKLGLKHEFYDIDETFRPIFDCSSLGEKDVLVYSNYFGICDVQAKEVAQRFKNVIVDNSHAFFSKPLDGVDTFYSPRKFFGVPDGAYLYTNELLPGTIEMDYSHERLRHLIKRIDLGSESGYEDFKKNENSLVNQPIKIMSELTQRLMKSIDYAVVVERRRKNFMYLHSKLWLTNRLSLNIDDESVPMVYPYFVPNGNEIRKELISQKIYIATYWPNILETCPETSFEYELADKALFLPVDQRYGVDEMSYMYEKLERISKMVDCGPNSCWERTNGSQR